MWNKARADEIYNQAKKLAATDKDFRIKLLSDPIGTIEELTGENLPKNFTMKIIETDPAYSATFLLPPLYTDEVSDDALDSVAGGSNYCSSDACSSKS